MKDRKQKTAEAVNNPQKGDRFSEMCSFWVIVLERKKDIVAVMEANPPCTLPKDGKIYYCTVKEFKKKYEYDTIPGSYWVSYYGNDSVDGWLKEKGGWKHKAQRKRKTHLVSADSLESIDTFCGKNMLKSIKSVKIDYSALKSDCLHCLDKKKKQIKNEMRHCDQELSLLKTAYDNILDRIDSIRKNLKEK